MEHLLGHPFRFGAWDLVGYYHQNLFWKALCEADRERAYGLVILVAEEDSSLRPYIEGGFKGVLDQQRDANLLLAIAQENRAKAVLVAHMLSAAMPGFWPIAVQIARTFPPENPDNEMVKFELERGVIEPEDMVHPEGKELAKFLRKRLKEMEELLAEDATPKEVCAWLEGLAERIRSAIKQTLISEAKEEIDRLRSGRLVDPEDAKDAAYRLFGVRTLLELGWLEQALQVSAQDELLRLLPKLKFSEQDETRLRQNIERGA